MGERLGWMDQVAQVKQARSLPITDTKREAELLDAMVKQGAAQGIPAHAVKAFFTGQMQAAKVYQVEWIQLHPHGLPGHKPAPDLAKTVRPALDKISAQMITGLAQARTSHDPTAIINEAAGRLARAGYSQGVAEPALHGLASGLAK
jgi:chorismate mutase-like protein